MKDYEDEAFDELEKAQQRKVATGVTDGSKVTIDRTKLEQVLEALELNNKEWKLLADSGDDGYWLAEEQDHYQQTEQAITAIKEALEDV